MRKHMAENKCAVQSPTKEHTARKSEVASWRITSNEPVASRGVASETSARRTLFVESRPMRAKDWPNSRPNV